MRFVSRACMENSARLRSFGFWKALDLTACNVAQAGALHVNILRPQDRVFCGPGARLVLFRSAASS